MNTTPPTPWTMFACCIVARTCSKFGNSMMRPVTLRTVPSTTTLSQNQPFSPALKRPEGTSCSPNMPPAFTSQVRSPLAGKLERT